MTVSPILVDSAGSKEQAMRAVLQIPLGGEAWAVTVAPHKEARSLGQNRLYWRWMTAIGKHTGHHKDEVHHWCSSRFLPSRIVDLDGCLADTRTSTTSLKVGEMAEYLMKVEAWAGTNLGLTLEPIPDEWRTTS